VLLKPTSEAGAQVVVLGKVVANESARTYHARKETLFAEAAAALDRLRSDFDLVVMEGAGSCAEMNLIDTDIVNIPMAEYAEAPVVLVADIHRGGVFAQIVGTLACLPPHRRERIAGSIVNRLRGDASLFEDGIRWLEKSTGKPIFGVLPWYTHISIESEDSVVLEDPRRLSTHRSGNPAVAVIRLPHIANFTDFAPLAAAGSINLQFLEHLESIADFAAVILPGSKNTRLDLEWLHTTGWAAALRAYAAQGGHVLGICGGYQMLGETVHDPDGTEGMPGSSPGLELLPVETVMKAPKTTTLTRFSWNGDEGIGYEIHMGQTIRHGGASLFQVRERNRRKCRHEDGCVAGGGRILGTYLHGLFDSPAITRRWLKGIGLENVTVADAAGPAVRDREYDLLADFFEQHVDIPKLLASTGIEIENGK
jgi:adenosylcobyric acid synthase